MGNFPVGTASLTICCDSGTFGVTLSKTTVKTASFVFDKMLVPLPSAALTAASLSMRAPLPLPLERNSIFKIGTAFPATPYGVPPISEINPSVLEKLGSSSQKLNEEPVLSKATTSSVSLGKRITACAALKLTPSLSTLSSTVNFSLTPISELVGVKKSVAALVEEKMPKAKILDTINTIILS